MAGKKKLMSKKLKLIMQIRSNPANVGYEDACKVAQWLGFEPKGGKGSHTVQNYYSIHLFFDSRDNAWVATSDEVPGCSAGGDTPVEAVQEFEVALEAWLEALQSTGNPLPKPRKIWIQSERPLVLQTA
jgi:antitoxin HicB